VYCTVSRLIYVSHYTFTIFSSSIRSVDKTILALRVYFAFFLKLLVIFTNSLHVAHLTGSKEALTDIYCTDKVVRWSNVLQFIKLCINLTN